MEDIGNICINAREPSKVLYLTAIPLRSTAAGEF